MSYKNTRQPFRSPGGYHCLWPWRLASLPSETELSLWSQSAPQNVISQPPDTALDSSRSYVTWMHIPFLSPLAFILQFHARNWDFCGTNSLDLQRLLSFAVMPWDSLGRACNQSYTIKEKSIRETVASCGRAGKLFVVSKKRHWTLQEASRSSAAASSSAVLPLGFLQKHLLSVTTPLEVLSPHQRRTFSSPGGNLEGSVDDGFAQFHFWLLNTF